ncbi:sulfite exporter TauE/SafE family protein [Chloroflexota bacterium]
MDMHNFDFISTTWIIVISAVFVAGFVRGVTGFAQSLILAPILLLFIDSRSVVIINILLATLTNFVMLPFTWRSLEWRKLVPLSTASLLGLPLGAYIIQTTSPLTLKMLISWLVIVFAIPLAFGITIKLRRERLAATICGFLSGFLSTSTSINGPPVVLFMHNQNWRKDAIYATLNIYFLFLGISSLCLLTIFLGNIISEFLIGTAYMAPALLFGLALGRLTFTRINAEFFRLVSILVVIVAGIAGILSGFGIF